MIFNAYGHRNITGLHKTTLEFTKDDYVTERGDCILGILSDFSFTKLKLSKIRISLKTGHIEDELFCYYNKMFSSSHSMVIRKSDYIDNRTFATASNKAAADIDRRIITRLKNPKTKIRVDIKPVRIKAVIFDFDDTIEEFTAAQEYAEKKLVEYLVKNIGIDKGSFARTFKRVRARYESTAKRPENYGRDVWLKETFRQMKIKIGNRQIKEYERVYWKFCNKKVRLFPGVKDMLKQIKLKKALLSDADGDRRIKADRIKLLGVDKLFKVIVTSNDTGHNKPHISNFLSVVEKLHVKPEECIMVGNRPKSDLLTAKGLGMTTVLVRTGSWYEKVNYADFEIETVKEILRIISYFQFTQLISNNKTKVL